MLVICVLKSLTVARSSVQQETGGKLAVLHVRKNLFEFPNSGGKLF